MIRQLCECGNIKEHRDDPACLRCIQLDGLDEFEGLNKTEGRLVDLLSIEGIVPTDELAVMVGVSHRQTLRILGQMDGYIVQRVPAPEGDNLGEPKDKRTFWKLCRR